MNPHETHVEDLIGRALVPYSDRPDADGVARLVDDLITRGATLYAEVAALPGDRRTELTRSALAEWSYFVDAGPTGRGDHANWNHARALARILRNLASALGEQPSRAR
ncbi:DUF6415 family natural product biosynthesis protein [Streptomyces lavendulae]|uniref:DUF6415 family natural product biosynthesis protein n=1 Tax=Streptomyces lavendulae TaxID=1914 RepID=UPI00331EC6D8